MHFCNRPLIVSYTLVRAVKYGLCGVQEVLDLRAGGVGSRQVRRAVADRAGLHSTNKSERQTFGKHLGRE